MWRVLNPDSPTAAATVAQAISTGDLCLCEVLRHLTLSDQADELVDKCRAALGQMPFRDGKRVSDLLQSLTARAVDVELDYATTALPEGY